MVVPAAGILGAIAARSRRASAASSLRQAADDERLRASGRRAILVRDSLIRHSGGYHDGYSALYRLKPRYRGARYVVVSLRLSAYGLSGTATVIESDAAGEIDGRRRLARFDTTRHETALDLLGEYRIVRKAGR